MMLNQPHMVPVRTVDGKEMYRLEADYTFSWFAESTGWKLVVPAGFISDGASVPRVGALLGIYPDGLHRAAALVHDWLYRWRGEVPPEQFLKNDGHGWVPVRVGWTRAQVDKLFANMLAVAGVGRARRRLMYLAVRAVGWLFWKGVLK